MIAIEPWFYPSTGSIAITLPAATRTDVVVLIEARREAETDVAAFLRAAGELEERSARRRALSVSSRGDARSLRVTRRPPAPLVLPRPWPAALRAFS